MPQLAYSTPDRFVVSDALARANELITLAAEHRSVRANPFSEERRQTLRQVMSRKVDELLDTSLDGIEQVDDIGPIFERHFAMTEEDIGKLPRELVPLAIMRELLSKHRVVFDQDAVPNWDRFAELYKDVARY